MSEALSVTLLVPSAFFFLAGTVGVLRFPDVYTRLHALTKADNLGLGFLVLSLSVHAPDLAVIGELVMIWVLVLASSSISCQLIARAALRAGYSPWRQP